MSTVAIRGTGNPRQPTEHVDRALTESPSRTREQTADARIPFLMERHISTNPAAYHNLERDSGPRTTTSATRARRLALENAYVTGQTTRGDGGL
ncbi:hypothetical protein BE21_48915 [Sorangium cellulosum]|uniref:Uncharacterized protein n=1 Tax=Sorangium cellulosum TaxID=56 RepID=A0A150THA3_SORCE|nr:hypothetical protein BE21_48915 [Sorangium cellulosum]